MQQGNIELRGVDVFYDQGKPTEVHALKSISFSVAPGEYVCLFGPSGSGKSSILYAASGIEIPPVGRIESNGRDLQKLSSSELAQFRQDSVGIVFQYFNLLPTLDVIHNVALPLTFAGVPEKTRLGRAQEILNRLNIAPLARRLPHELSGGQQQRVGIARAIINNPPIILADEPLGSLDSVNAENVLAFLDELHKKDGRTVVMVTHEAWSLKDADRVIYMRDGEIIKTETKKDDKEPVTAEEAYATIYPEASKEEVAAGVFADVTLHGGEDEDKERMRLFFADLIEKRISLADFAGLLEAPWEEGGLGLWPTQVVRIMARARDLIEGLRPLDQIALDVEKKDRDNLKRDILRLTHWALTTLGPPARKIAEQDTARLGAILARYLQGKYNVASCAETLTLPYDGGGLSMPVSEAARLAERLALLRVEHQRLEFK